MKPFLNGVLAWGYLRSACARLDEGIRHIGATRAHPRPKRHVEETRVLVAGEDAIVAIGADASAATAKVIRCQGKELTPGLVGGILTAMALENRAESERSILRQPKSPGDAAVASELDGLDERTTALQSLCRSAHRVG